MNLTELNEEQLLLSAKQGTAESSEALGLLLLRSQPQLKAQLSSQIGNRLQASVSPDDVLQETYRQVFTSFDSFRGTELSEFNAWVRQIGVNQIRQLGRSAGAKKRGGELQRVSDHDAFRSRAGGLLDEISTGDATVSQFVAKTEAVEALQIALASLPSEQQRAVRLRYFDQLSIDDVATTMSCSRGSVRGLLDRAKQTLRVSMHNSALWLSKRQ